MNRKVGTCGCDLQMQVHHSCHMMPISAFTHSGFSWAAEQSHTVTEELLLQVMMRLWERLHHAGHHESQQPGHFHSGQQSEEESFSVVPTLTEEPWSTSTDHWLSAQSLQGEGKLKCNLEKGHRHYHICNLCCTSVKEILFCTEIYKIWKQQFAALTI